MSRLQARFRELGAHGEGALIGHLVAGDPDLAQGREYARALLAAGIDALELSIPFSDPVADDSALQAAHLRALQAGIRPPAIFELVRELRRETSSPILLMTYYNPVLAIGEEAFVKRCFDASVDGVGIWDLPVEEATAFVSQARRYRIDTIFLATTETGDERLKMMAGETTGFLYIASRYGRTESFLARARALLPPELPCVVECESSTSEGIRATVRAGAQGIVMGSSLAERIASGISPEALRSFVQELKVGGTRPNPPEPPQKPEMTDGAPPLSS